MLLLFYHCVFIPPGCPDGWVFHRSTLSCYKLNKDWVDYNTAFDNCRVIGSKLAMPVNEGENKMIVDLNKK